MIEQIKKFFRKITGEEKREQVEKAVSGCFMQTNGLWRVGNHFLSGEPYSIEPFVSVLVRHKRERLQEERYVNEIILDAINIVPNHDNNSTTDALVFDKSWILHKSVPCNFVLATRISFASQFANEFVRGMKS